MMTAKTKSEFMTTKRNINDKYSNYIKTSKAVIKLRGDVHFIPDPRMYSGTPGQKNGYYEGDFGKGKDPSV